MIEQVQTTDYLVPIAGTNTKWRQVCEIPVQRWQLTYLPHSYVYLWFVIDPLVSSKKNISPLDILAGADVLEGIEKAHERIRTQMIHRLETSLKDAQKPNSPLSTVLMLTQLSKYFS